MYMKFWRLLKGRIATGLWLAAASVVTLAASQAHCATPVAIQPADKFGWLEEQHGLAAVEWAKVRTDQALATLTKSSTYPAVQEELSRLLARGAPTPSLFRLGGHYVRLLRDHDHPSGLLQVAPFSASRPPVAWRTVLDVARMNRAEGGDLALTGASMFDFPDRCLPPAFNRCLLAFSPSGSSSLELREFDLKAAEFVAGGFQTPPNRSVTAWLNADTLLIGHSLFGSPSLPSNFPAVIRIWKRREPLAEAKPLFQAQPTTSLVEISGIGHGAERKGILTVVLDYSTIEYRIVEQSGATRAVGLPSKLKYVGRSARAYPYIAVQLAAAAKVAGKEYAAESIIAYDVRSHHAGPSYSEVFTPPSGDYVSDGEDGFDGAGKSVAFVLSRNLGKTLMLATPASGRWTTKPLQSAAPGEKLAIVKTDEEDSEILVRREGFLLPRTVSLLSPLDGVNVRIAADKPIIDPVQFRVEVRSARSRDGTSIDYYLVRPVHLHGPTPTLMSGYGAFGVNFDPDYFSGGLGRGMASWLMRGGAYAATAIRGGGERGDAWRLAGSGLNKQTSFDDFIAVADDLVGSGFTRRDMLGAFGRSGGGLLTAAMAAERPDLFGAIFVGVPVTDVGALASSGSGIIKGQKTEFGDWDDPAALKRILEYSPYQNVRDGVRYPPILIMTSTEDNQVGPGQARKFAARLEEAGGHPLLIEAPRGGHGVPDPVNQPELVSAEMVFFIDNLMGQPDHGLSAGQREVSVMKR